MWKEEADRLRDENRQLRDELLELKSLIRKKDEEIQKLLTPREKSFVRNK